MIHNISVHIKTINNTKQSKGLISQIKAIQTTLCLYSFINLALLCYRGNGSRLATTPHNVNSIYFNSFHTPKEL